MLQASLLFFVLVVGCNIDAFVYLQFHKKVRSYSCCVRSTVYPKAAIAAPQSYKDSVGVLEAED